MGSTKDLVGAAANCGLPVQQLPSLGYAWLVAQGLSDRPAGLFAKQRELSSLSVTRVIWHCASLSENFVRARPATHCHTPSHPVAPWAVMRQGAGSSRTLHTVLPSSCTYAQSRSSSLSLQLHERVAQSAYVAPTTKCKRRAAVLPKCVVSDGFYSMSPPWLTPSWMHECVD